MIHACFRTFIVVLVCSALGAIPAQHSVAQTSAEGSMPQEMTELRGLFSDGSLNVSGVSKKSREAWHILKTKHSCTKSGQMVPEANKTRPQREKQHIGPQRIEATLVEEISRPREFGRKMLKGTKLIHNDMLLMMKDEKGLSRAEKITREGHGMLERGQQIVMTPRL